MNQWILLTHRFRGHILGSVPQDPADLQRIRTSLDEARRTGWREMDRLSSDMEEYLSAVRASRRGARVLTGGAASSVPGHALP
jgi:hypothetical protein